MNKLLIDTLASDTIQELEKWWKDYRAFFEKQKITINTKQNQESFLLQRDNADDQRLKASGCDRESIPFLEVTPLYRKAEGGLLFVNCNPSGTDYSFYRNNNADPPKEIFYYDRGVGSESDGENDYFKAVREFSEKVCEKGFGNYAMIDAFPLVMQNQAVLKKAYIDAVVLGRDNPKRAEAFKALIKLFIQTIESINPKVIIITNAFVKGLFRNNPDEKNGNKLNIRLSEDIVTVDPMDKDFVCYKIKTSHNFESTVFCGGMIAGGHQMDTDSRERLIRDIKRFIGSH